MFARLKSQRERDRDRERDPPYRRRHPRPPRLTLPRSNSSKYLPKSPKAPKSGRIEEEISNGSMWCIAARRGRRRTHREDTYAVLPFIGSFQQPLSIFAVFDGHGGKQAAEFASTRLPQLFLEQFRGCGVVKDSLEFAFLKTDQEVIEEFYGNDDLSQTKNSSAVSGQPLRRRSSLFSRKSRVLTDNSPARSPAGSRGPRLSPSRLGRKSDFSPKVRGGLFDGLKRFKSRDDSNMKSGCGCTATVVVMMNNRLNIAHVGDSRAVLCRNNNVRRLCEDHRPCRVDEQQRIESCGGLILDTAGTPRVNGVLAVTRSIGDAELKDFVIATPEVTEILLEGNDEFVVVASDGLWDVVSDDECVKIVRELLHQGEEEAGKKLVQVAWDRGSNDDICVMIINLVKYGKVLMKDVADASEMLSPDGESVAERKELAGKRHRASREIPSGQGELPVEIVTPHADTPHADVPPTPRVWKKKAW